MNKANAWSAHAEGKSGGKKCAQLAELIWRWHLSAPRDPAADGVDADDNVDGDLERRARQFLKWDISSGSCGCWWKPFDEGEKLLLRCSVAVVVMTLVGFPGKTPPAQQQRQRRRLLEQYFLIYFVSCFGFGFGMWMRLTLGPNWQLPARMLFVCLLLLLLLLCHLWSAEAAN